MNKYPARAKARPLTLPRLTSLSSFFATAISFTFPSSTSTLPSYDAQTAIMNIRRATIEDLMGMQNCNLHNLPEVSSLSSFLSTASVSRFY